MRTINILCCRLIAEIPVQAAFLCASKQAIVNIFGYRWKSYQLITFTTQFLTHFLIANCRFQQKSILKWRKFLPHLSNSFLVNSICYQLCGSMWFIHGLWIGFATHNHFHFHWLCGNITSVSCALYSVFWLVIAHCPYFNVLQFGKFIMPGFESQAPNVSFIAFIMDAHRPRKRHCVTASVHHYTPGHTQHRTLQLNCQSLTLIAILIYNKTH